ncbi:hypothetical protein SLE2022_051060 [Rubroshorea leprosula]
MGGNSRVRKGLSRRRLDKGEGKIQTSEKRKEMDIDAIDKDFGRTVVVRVEGLVSFVSSGKSNLDLHLGQSLPIGLKAAIVLDVL